MGMQRVQVYANDDVSMASLLLLALMVAALTVPDERGLCQNCAQSRDPHHMGDTGCYFSSPAVLPPLTITP